MRPRNLGVCVAQVVLDKIIKFDIVQCLIIHGLLWFTGSEEFFKSCLDLVWILIDFIAAVFMSSRVELVEASRREIALKDFLVHYDVHNFLTVFHLSQPLKQACSSAHRVNIGSFDKFTGLSELHLLLL